MRYQIVVARQAVRQFQQATPEAHPQAVMTADSDIPWIRSHFKKFSRRQNMTAKVVGDARCARQAWSCLQLIMRQLKMRQLAGQSTTMRANASHHAACRTSHRWGRDARSSSSSMDSKVSAFSRRAAAQADLRPSRTMPCAPKSYLALFRKSSEPNRRRRYLGQAHARAQRQRKLPVRKPAGGSLPPPNRASKSLSGATASQHRSCAPAEIQLLAETDAAYEAPSR